MVPQKTFDSEYKPKIHLSESHNIDNFVIPGKVVPRKVVKNFMNR